MAARHDLRVEQGATLDTAYQWLPDGVNPQDITNWSAKLQIRRTPGDQVILTATTADSSIDIVGPSGLVQLDVPAATTAALTGWDTATYDLVLTSPAGRVKRLAEGRAIWAPRVTV